MLVVAAFVTFAIAPKHLLVASPGVSAGVVAQAVRSFGKVVETTQGFVVLEVDRPMGEASAIAHVRELGFTYVLPERSTRLDRTSLRSVREHMTFLRAKAALEGADEPAEAAEWLEAYEAYLKARVDANGNLDRAGNGFATMQRNALPPASSGGPAGGYAPTGSFTLVGPKSTDVPYPKMGKPPLSGRKNEVKWAPSNTEIMWTTSAGGGVWKSTDGGTTWSCKSNGSIWEAQACDGLAIHPTNPSVVYVGTGDDDKSVQQPWGVMKTTDGGQTWTNQGRATFGDDIITELYIPPTQGSTVIALTTDGPGGNVYRTTNGGSTWSIVASAPYGRWEDIDRAPNGTLYICGMADWNPNPVRVYKSTDNGATWTSVNVPTQITGESATDIACSKLNSNRMYLYSAAEEDIFKTTNGGSTWTPMNMPKIAGDWDQKTYNYYVETSVNGNSDRIYVGQKTINSSKDGGTTWVDLTKSQDPVDSRIHTDQHCMDVHPSDPNLLLVGNDGGVFKLDHQAAAGFISWWSLNESMTDALCYHIALHPTNMNYVMTGCQDLATPSSLGNLSNWSNLMGGDGTWCQFHPSLPDFHYSSEQKLDIHEYATPNTKVDTPISQNWTSVAFVAPFVFAGSTPTIIGGANKRLMVYSGFGTTWGTGSTIVTDGGDVTELAVAPSNTNIVYSGSEDGKVFRVDLGTNIYDDPSLGAPWGADGIGAIAVNPNNPNDILVGLNKYEASRLYRCSNTTAAVPTWTDVTGTVNLLPSAPVNGVAWDPYNEGTWYVASDVGLFMTTSFGYNWANMSALGLPNVHCEDVQVHPNEDYLYVGTFGRGIWRIPLSNITFQSLTISPLVVYEGGTSTATVRLSAGAPPGTTATILDFSTALSQPTSVTFNTGSTSKTWTMTTSDVSSTTDVLTSVSLMGTVRSITLRIEPYPHVSTVSMNPSSVYGGTNSVATIHLNQAAPIPVTIQLTDDSSAVSGPSSVVIGTGQTSVPVTFTTTAVGTTQTAHINASVDGVQVTGNLTIRRPLLTSLSVVPSSVVGGQSSTGTIFMNAAAPSGGLSVSVSDSSLYTSVPPSVSVLQGQLSANFQITTTHPLMPVNATITAISGGVVKTATLRVNP